MRIFRKKAIAQNDRLKKLVKKRQELYEKYTDSVESEIYKQMKAVKAKMSAEEEDPDIYFDFIDATHFQNTDEFGEPVGKAILIGIGALGALSVIAQRTINSTETTVEVTPSVDYSDISIVAILNRKASK